MFSTASISLSKSVFYLNLLAVRSIPTLSDSLFVNTRVGKLEETLETENDRRNALSSQMASKDVELVVKVAPIDGLGVCFRM